MRPAIRPNHPAICLLCYYCPCLEANSDLCMRGLVRPVLSVGVLIVQLSAIVESTVLTALPCQVVKELHPAVAVLAAIWDDYDKVYVNKEKLGHLLDRCKRVIGAVDQELSRSAPSDVGRSIQQLLRYFAMIA